MTLDLLSTPLESCHWTLLLTAVLSLLVLLYCLLYQQSIRGLPPFPARPLPFLGNIFDLDKDWRPQFKRWRRKHGDIFSFYLGSTLYIAINGPEMLREVLVKNGGLLKEKFLSSSLKARMGVIFNNGSEERRDVLTKFIQLGMKGSNKLVQEIHKEISLLVQSLSREEGKTVEAYPVFFSSLIRYTISFATGKSVLWNDPDVQSIYLILREAHVVRNQTTRANFFPVLRNVPSDPFNLKRLESLSNRLDDLSKKHIRDVKARIDDPCYISHYLKRQAAKSEAGQSTLLGDDDLVRALSELHFGGSESLAMVLIWWALYMAHSPDVQAKAYNEIKDRVGLHRPPTLEDRPSLRYVNAVVMETLRLSLIIPLTFPHVCGKEFLLRGYTIPKGANIIPCLFTASHDDNIWGQDALKLRPERFLDKEGHVIGFDESNPFSIGKRSCPGEVISKAALFLYTSGILQRFEIRPSESELPPPEAGVFDGVLHNAPDFKVKFVDRHQC